MKISVSGHIEFAAIRRQCFVSEGVTDQRSNQINKKFGVAGGGRGGVLAARQPIL